MFWNLILISPPPPQSSDFFSSSVWTFLSGFGAIVAIPIAIIATATAILAYRKQKSQAQEERIVKELMYEVVSDAPIANINTAVADRVEIHFDGHPVSDMFLLILRIVNTGNVAVKREDYAEPLEVIFKGSKVISSDVLETSPKNLIHENNLKNFFRLEDHSLMLLPILLNQGESITIKILLAGNQHDMELRARIADGYIITAAEQIKRQRIVIEQRERRIRTFGVAIGLITVIMSIFLSLYISSIEHIPIGAVISSFFGPLLFFAAFIIFTRTTRNR